MDNQQLQEHNNINDYINNYLLLDMYEVKKIKKMKKNKYFVN